jgi:hypothetical protein
MAENRSKSRELTPVFDKLYETGLEAQKYKI